MKIFVSLAFACVLALAAANDGYNNFQPPAQSNGNRGGLFGFKPPNFLNNIPFLNRNGDQTNGLQLPFGGFVGDIVNRIRSFFDGIFKRIAETLSRIEQRLKDGAGSLQNRISDTTNGLSNGLSNGVNGMVNGANGFVDGASDAAQKLGQGANRAANDLVSNYVG